MILRKFEMVISTAVVILLVLLVAVAMLQLYALRKKPEKRPQVFSLPPGDVSYALYFCIQGSNLQGIVWAQKAARFEPQSEPFI